MIEPDFFSDLFFDLQPIRFLQQFFGLGHPLPFEILSAFGDTWGMAFVVGLALWLWGRKTAYGVAGTLALGAATKSLLTEVIFSGERPRGEGIVVYEHIATGSFPSGHVYQVVGAWGWLAAIGHLSWFWPLCLAAAVSVGRLYLASHYLGDVLAGVLFGLGFVAAYYYGWPKLEAWLAQKSFRFFAMLGALGVAAVAATLTYSFDSPHRWGVVGLAVGMVPGLLLEYRYVRFEPAPVSRRVQVLKAGLGLAGIALCYVIYQVWGPEVRLCALTTTALAGAWAALGAPALFARLGWSREPLRYGSRPVAPAPSSSRRTRRQW